MGCNCKGTKKGIPNLSDEKWLAENIYKEYTKTIEKKSIQYFTSQQRTFVIEKYYEVYPNSTEVTYKQANSTLINLFRYHNLI